MNTLEARRRLIGRNVYKRTTEGNTAIAQGSLARRYPGITMQGWTEQDSYEGNQLFDASVFDGIEKSGVSISVDNGVITASGMSESTIWIQSANFTEKDFEKFKSGNIYVKNYKTSDCNYEVGIYINNTTVKEGNSPYNIPDGYLETNPNNVRFFIDIRAGVELKGSCKPIVYQDGDGTWEPYTGRAPSPSPDYPQEIVSAGNWNEEAQKWEYEIEVGGANLFDISKVLPVTRGDNKIEIDGNKIIVTNGVGSNGVYPYAPNTLRDYCPEIEAGNEYTFTFITTGSIKNIYLSSVATAWASGQSKVVTEEMLNSSIAFYASGLSTSAEITNIMFNKGSTALPYEPYRTPQTVILTADRPLTKWDRLEKRGGQWGWAYKSNTTVLNGDEEWKTIGSGFYIVNGIKNMVAYDKNILIDKLIYALSGEYPRFIVVSSGRSYTPSIFNVADSVNGMKEWLASNPLTLCYETAEETFVPLSESEQEQMNELYTFRPTTVLSNDCGCNMTLTYKTKKSLEVAT